MHKQNQFNLAQSKQNDMKTEDEILKNNVPLDEMVKMIPVAKVWVIKAMKEHTAQETQILRDQLRENSEREARLLKQIELKQLYTKDQVESEREKAFKSGIDRIIMLGGEEVSPSKFYEEYKQQNPLK